MKRLKHTCCPGRGWELAGHSAARSSPAGSDTLVPGPHQVGRCRGHSRAFCRARSPAPHRASSGSWWSLGARCWCISSECSHGSWSRSGSARDGKCPTGRPPACLEEEERERKKDFYMCGCACRITNKQLTRGWYECNEEGLFQACVSQQWLCRYSDWYMQLFT